MLSNPNNIIVINTTLFEDNFSFGRGSLVFADENSYIEFNNC